MLFRFKRTYLHRFLFVSLFLIFIPLIPIGIETQPTLALFTSIILIAGFSNPKELLKLDVFFVCLLSVILTIYATWQFFFKFDYKALIEFLKYLIGPIIFFAIRTSKFSVSFPLLKKVVIGLAIVAGISLFLPGIYVFIFRYLIPRFVDNVGSDARGIVILTPEPSYFAVFQIILLITIEKALSQLNYEQSEEVDYNKKQLLYLKYVVIFISLLTKSAVVILYVLIFLIPELKRLSFKKLFIWLLIIIPLISIVVYFFFSENRLFDVISLVYKLVSEDEFDWMNFLFNQESSGGTRIIVNFLAIASLFINPFGSGLGSFSSMIGFYSEYFNMDLSKHEVLGGDLGKIYPQTYFANLCNDIGIFSLVLFPILLINNASDSRNFVLKRNLCLVIMILFQSQITNPAFWYLIAVSKINTDEKIIK